MHQWFHETPRRRQVFIDPAQLILRRALRNRNLGRWPYRRPRSAKNDELYISG
jgi:hypothetical protein